VVAGAAGVVAAALVSAAVAEGFGVGVTRTWNPPHASMAISNIASAQKSGQSLGRRYIFASKRETRC
jgi:hypothetical protein